MLDRDTRQAVLELKQKGHGIRTIARVLKIDRKSVKRILESGAVAVPELDRPQKADPFLDRIRGLYNLCKGNLSRVHEELEKKGVDLSYSALTAFCRKHGIGVKEKKAAGQYHFDPGEEMQHDTSPHEVRIGGRKRKVQCAGLVFCYSRMVFAQVYPTFNRFYCKCFLSDGICYMGGACEWCMIDNTSVVVASGTGKNAVMAPEMDAFGDRFGYKFRAHEKGDANRSARAERFFHFVENNFYPGRTFSDFKDLNKQFVAWCDKVNRSFKRHLNAKPVELFQAERPFLKPLPIHIPEVYELHGRHVDLEGYVRLHTNRYSMPVDMIGRQVQLRETKDQLRIFDGHKLVATHELEEPGARKRKTLDEHKGQGRWKKARWEQPSAEEKVLRAAGSDFCAMVDALKKRGIGRGTRAIRRLHRIYLEYPSEAVQKALTAALQYRLFDLERIERMVLRNVAGEFFRVPSTTIPEEGDGEEEADK
jgi:transposase